MVNILDQFTGNIQKQAADLKTAGLQAGMTDYGKYADLGRGALTTNYTDALKGFQGLQPQAMGGYSAYADATGANGPEGLARANAQYLQGTPGFAGAAQRAADMAARAGVAGGQATGNTLAAIGDRTTQMGLDAYNQYVSRLQPYLGQATNVAQGLGGIYGNLGQGLAGSYGNQATAMLGANKDIGAAEAEGKMGELTGLQNLTNFGMNAAKLGVGAMTGGAGTALMGGLGSGMFGGLTNNFMGGGSFNPPRYG
jgi:hypothetical protein